jgi:uncharacterized protein (TIGR02145 family)
MKKLFTLFAIVTTITIFAQAPQGFNYQAIVRNSSGQLLLNQDVLVKFNILQNSATGDIVYSETQTANTDDLGQINLVVGQGTASAGTFSSINWANGSYYLGIELNTGTGYIAMGTSQLLSVPFALYAQNSGSTQQVISSLQSVLATNNSANSIKITNLGDPIDAKDAVNKDYVDALQTQISNLETIIINSGVYTLTDADNNVYHAVKIGNQVWMKENLKTTKYCNGDVIPNKVDNNSWMGSYSSGAWSYYNNDSTNNAIYGKLYNWRAAADSRNICPCGWHLPTYDDWNTVINYLGGANVAGSKLKESGAAHWLSPNTDATNLTGFTAVGGGVRGFIGNFTSLGSYSYFWIQQFWSGGYDAYYMALNNNDGTLTFNSLLNANSNSNGSTGLSIRCIRN